MQVEVRGKPTPEELAAVMGLLMARGGGKPEPAAPPQSSWNDRAALLRPPLRHGPDAWRSSL